MNTPTLGSFATVVGSVVAMAATWGSLASAAAPATTAAAATAAEQRATLDTYCVTCHNQRLKTAGLALDALDVTAVGPAAATWEKVIKKVRTGAMPPRRDVFSANICRVGAFAPYGAPTKPTAPPGRRLSNACCIDSAVPTHSSRTSGRRRGTTRRCRRW